MMEDALNNARKAMGTAEYWARMWYKTQVNGVYEGNQLRIHSWIQVKFELDNIEKAMIVAAVGSELNAIDNEVWLGSKRMEECNGRTDFFFFFLDYVEAYYKMLAWWGFHSIQKSGVAKEGKEIKGLFLVWLIPNEVDCTSERDFFRQYESAISSKGRKLWGLLFGWYINILWITSIFLIKYKDSEKWA